MGASIQTQSVQIPENEIEAEMLEKGIRVGLKTSFQIFRKRV
jgi:hypothetical protein